MAIITKLTDLTPTRDRLRRKIPLVSGGFAAREHFPDGQVVIRPWDSHASEWAVDNRFAIGQTKKLAELATIISLADLKAIKLLTEGDLVAMIMTSRALTFKGARVDYQPVCPRCGRTQKPASIVIPDELGVHAQKQPDYPGFEPVGALPEAGDEIELRPLLVNDLIDLQEAERELSARGLSKTQAALAKALVSVGGGKPENLVEAGRYVSALPIDDINFLDAAYDKISPRLDTDIPHRCDFDDCRHEFKFTLELIRDFFRL